MSARKKNSVTQFRRSWKKYSGKRKKGATQKLNIPTKDKLEMNPTQIASLRGSELSGRTSSDAYLRI